MLITVVGPSVGRRRPFLTPRPGWDEERDVDGLTVSG